MKFDHIFELLPERAFRALGGRLLSLEGGGGKGSKSPPPPDYTSAAKETAKGEKSAALAAGALDRPTQINPYGELTWTLKEGASASNPKPGDWIQTQTFSAPQQGIFDAEMANSLGMAQLAGTGIENAGNILGTGLNVGRLPTAPGDISSDPASYAAQRQATQDAVYNRATQYYGDRFARDEGALKQELANKGLTEGTEAYRNAMLEFGRGKDTAYADAADRAILAGGQEQSRIQNDLINALQQQQNRRNNALQEALAIRQLPLNEINALRTGAQLQSPTFASFQPSKSFSGPDLLGATSAQYAAQSQSEAARQAAMAQNMNTYGNLAASALLSMDW